MHPVLVWILIVIYTKPGYIRHTNVADALVFSTAEKCLDFIPKATKDLEKKGYTNIIMNCYKDKID